MLKLFASKITNLTDARYFAAYMPTFMSISLPGDTVATINDTKTIMSWIDGVQWLIEFEPGQTFNPLTVQELEPAGIHYIGLESFDPELHNVGIKVISVREDELDRVTSNPSILSIYDQVVLPGNVKISEIRTIANAVDTVLWLNLADVKHRGSLQSIQGLIAGILVEGGDEEKVGLKSFDHLDEFLDRVIS